MHPSSFEHNAHLNGIITGIGSSSAAAGRTAVTSELSTARRLRKSKGVGCVEAKEVGCMSRFYTVGDGHSRMSMVEKDPTIGLDILNLF